MPEPENATAIQAFTEIIKKQLAIFGPDITFALIKHIKGLEVDAQGTVVNISDTPQHIVQGLIAGWQQLSPFLAKRLAETTTLKA